MTEIINALKAAGVTDYRIIDVNTESREAFLVKRRLDLKRGKNVRKITVKVFNVFEADGKKMKGQTDVFVFPGMKSEELVEKFRAAYKAAGFVKNPYYEFAAKEVGCEKQECPELGAALGTMAKALYDAEKEDGAYINSAEFFAEKTGIRIVCSNGTDVSYDEFRIKGEFVAQCKEPLDVETYMNFAYDTADAASLTKLARETLDTTLARAKATEAPKAGNYRIIISGRYVKNIFDYYIERSGNAYVYAGYSDYKIGDKVQGEDIKGDKLNLTLKAKEPYSTEGIKMQDLKLIENGELKAYHGSERFAYYLGIKPTGDHSAFEVEKGKVTLEEMKAKPYLNIVNFSDFQVDAFNGSFGGEIRLAFLFDGEKTVPVTGGSVNGSLIELKGDMTLSAETLKQLDYEGPAAVCFENVNVAGV